MSYRDLRNFTEMMRALGYKRLISMENFKNPTFPLVAEILTWLALRFEPNADVPSEIDSAQDRIIFMKFIIEFMLTKANTKLNPKRLYEADGHSVKELLKVTRILYGASCSRSSKNEEDDPTLNRDESMSVMMELAGRSQELTEARKLATELTGKGATLYDLLGREVDLRVARIGALSKQLELNDIEKTIVQGSKRIEDEIRLLMSKIENVASDEANLEVKIEKKKAELERNRKRFDALQTVRPAYMDEMEKLEEELQSLYEEYMTKYRNVSFLESIYDKYRKYEKDLGDIIESQVKRTLAKVYVPNKNMSLADDLNDDDDDDEDDVDDDDDDDDDDDEDEGRIGLRNGDRGRGFPRRIGNAAQRNGFENRPTTGRRVPPKKTTFMLDDDDDEDGLNLSGDSVDIAEEEVDEGTTSAPRGAPRGKPLHHRMDGRPVAATRGGAGNGSAKARTKPESDDDNDDEDDF